MPKFIGCHHKKFGRKSIFIKLLFLLIVIGFLVNIIVFIFFKLMFGSTADKILQKNIANYSNYIIQDIGVPPDTTRARNIAQQYSIMIRFESPDMIWASSKKLPSIDESISQRHHRKSPHMRLWMNDYIITNDDGSKFLFRSNLKHQMKPSRNFIFGFILILGLILSIAHFYIRRVLQPVHWLTNGINKIGEGNLDFQIPIKQNDELGRLSEAFNAMTKRIKEMIKSRDQLLLDVSHELRSPITRIKLALELIGQSKRINNIKDDISEMETMITEILESERLKDGFGKLKLSKVNIVKILKNTIKDYQERPPGIIIKSLPESLMLEIDIERIKIVFKNIFENSIKYSKTNSNPIEISLLKQEDSITIKIKDYGIGIPEEHMPYLFEPFYRVDKSRSKNTGGYGLGLNLCKKIIEAHNGDLEIFNNKNSGITITIELPYSKSGQNIERG